MLMCMLENIVVELKVTWYQCTKIKALEYEIQKFAIGPSTSTL